MENAKSQSSKKMVFLFAVSGIALGAQTKPIIAESAQIAKPYLTITTWKVILNYWPNNQRRTEEN